MGNTCKPMAVSFQCMTKFTTNKKKNNKKKTQSFIREKKKKDVVSWRLTKGWTQIFQYPVFCSMRWRVNTQATGWRVSCLTLIFLLHSTEYFTIPLPSIHLLLFYTSETLKKAKVYLWGSKWRGPIYNWSKAVWPAFSLNSQVSFSKTLSIKSNFVEVALHLECCI